MSRARRGVVALLAVLPLACAGPGESADPAPPAPPSAGAPAPALSDTGFVGTWRRAAGAGRSTIAIAPTPGGGHRFDWRLEDGERRVVCDADGVCRESIAGEAKYEHRFRLLERPGESGLFIECTGRPLVEGLAPRRYVDRLELREGGLELWSWTVELDGQAIDPPRGPVRFAKVSDDPTR